MGRNLFSQVYIKDDTLLPKAFWNVEKVIDHHMHGGSFFMIENFCVKILIKELGMANPLKYALKNG